MAEAAVNPNGNGGQAGNAAGNNSNGQQDPAWLTHIPDQYREEARKSYLLNSDYTQKTQALSAKEKEWDTEKQKIDAERKYWGEFKSQYDPFYQKVQANWDKIAPILNGVNQARAEAKAGNEPDPFEDYDLLPPREQAKRLADFTSKQSQGSFQGEMEKLKQELQQTIAQHSNAFRNYLAIQTDAYDRKFTNPEMNLKDYLETALKFQGGQINPLEAAYEKVTSESTLKKMQEEWLRKGKEEALLELQNKGLTPGGMQSQSNIPVFGQKPMNRAQVAEAVRAEALKQGRSW